MSRIYRVSMMIYGSLQAKLMGTTNNGHIQRYRTPILVTLSFIYLNRLTKIIKYFGCCNIWFDSISQCFTSKTGLL